MLIIPQNIGSPSAITITINSPIFGVDLTTVTAVRLAVRRYDGSTTTWVAAIKSATSRELIAQYLFADLGEITTTGMYRIQPQLVTQAGSQPATAVAMFVSNAYSTQANTETDTWVATASEIQSAGASSNEWFLLDDTASPWDASPVVPYYALDLSAGAITVNLWDAADGDVVVLSDIYGAAASHSLTLVGNGSQLVPVGNGTYAASNVYSTANFVLRLKFLGTRWLPF